MDENAKRDRAQVTLLTFAFDLIEAAVISTT